MRLACDNVGKEDGNLYPKKNKRKESGENFISHLCLLTNNLYLSGCFVKQMSINT